MADTFEVIISELAEQDLEHILKYLITEAGLVTTAKIQQLFLEAIKGLKRTPTAHGLVRELYHLDDNKFRRILIKKTWRIIFEIDESSSTVYVIRILHVKRGPGFVKKALE